MHVRPHQRAFNQRVQDSVVHQRFFLATSCWCSVGAGPRGRSPRPNRSRAPSVGPVASLIHRHTQHRSVNSSRSTGNLRMREVSITHDAQRTTHNAQRTTHNAQRTAHPHLDDPQQAHRAGPMEAKYGACFGASYECYWLESAQDFSCSPPAPARSNTSCGQRPG
jgi:hypothetical protein